MTTANEPGFVLYVDHQGHPAPLSECFHATASRRLSSTVDRLHRPSTVTQVDSAFCPQCLSFHDASSASQLGYCPKPSCVQCPLCTSIVSCAKIDSYICYACGRCSWNSAQCNLQVESTWTEVSKGELVEAATKLAEMLKERREAGGHLKAAENHYKNMIAAWEGVVKPLSKSSASTRSSILFKGRRKEDEDAWSVDALESAIQKKKDSFVADVASTLGGIEIQRISLDVEQTLDSSLQDQPVESIILQALNGVPVMTSMADLLPLAVPLRSRKSRRCRAELAEGKPGILLKPKLNPLEGDSSLRTGHGQWWKKDSSAVHVLPRVRVIRHESKVVDDKRQHAFLLKVTNPTLGMVRLQMGLSTYKGESFWDDRSDKNPALENILVESLSGKHVDAFLLTPTTANNEFNSELVDLDSAEDTIVDIGKILEVPEEVSNWDAEKAMTASPPSNEVFSGLDEKKVSFVGTKLLAKQSGSAWFELIFATKLLEIADHSLAIPISLQIEVGNGSWESSLIKANRTEEGKEADMVSFDLVITWRCENN